MLSGREYQPWQMLAPGRFGLHFAPASPGGMHERVNGDRAIVTVTGDKPGQRAEVPLVREHGKWRIKLRFRRCATPRPAGRDRATVS